MADFYPRLGEYLAAQHGAGYDAAPGRARFRAWLGEHAEADDANPVREYLKQVSRVPGLTAEQEAELAQRIEAGLAAERKLAEGGDRLAASERNDRSGSPRSAPGQEPAAGAKRGWWWRWPSASPAAACRSSTWSRRETSA